jgi:hypothetical protein
MNARLCQKQASRAKRMGNSCRWERAGFQVFLSLDRGIEYEQNLKKHAIAIILVHAQSSRLADLLPRVPNILKALDSIQPGQLLHVS